MPHCGDCGFSGRFDDELDRHDCSDVVGECESCAEPITARMLAEGNAEDETMCLAHGDILCECKVCDRRIMEDEGIDDVISPTLCWDCYDGGMCDKAEGEREDRLLGVL